MHLIATLAAGLADAQDGHVALLRRGTATPASYYRDFEATQVYTATPIALDSNGSAVLYVNELVDVVVYDADGVQQREFVAGDGAPAVEVISRAFTGIDYQTGVSGTSKPTTLAAVLDKWATSAGAADWNVQTAAGAVSLQVAVAGLQGLFFNVKSYGALGDGSANDGPAIANAIAAATTLGGIVFFPPGTYRANAAIALPSNITLMGCGAPASKLAFADTAASGLVPAAGTVGSITRIIGMWLGSLGSLGVGPLIDTAAAARLDVYDCVLGNDNTRGALVGGGSGSTTAIARFTRCSFVSQSSFANPLVQNGGNRMVFRDCDFSLGAAALSASGGFIQGGGNSLFDGCRFSGGAATFVAAIVYIAFIPSGVTTVPQVVNCAFATYAFGAATAFWNQSATPAYDILESNNRLEGGVTAYFYNTDGYATAASSVGSHGSRAASMEAYAAYTAASLVANPKAFGVTHIDRTATATLILDAAKGRVGDTWVLQIRNTTGGALTVQPVNTNIIFTTGPGVNVTVPNTKQVTLQLAWMPYAGGTTGRWVQTGPQAEA